MAGDAVDSRHEDSAFAVGENAAGRALRATRRVCETHRKVLPIEVTDARDATAALKKLDADRAATAVLLDVGENPTIRSRSRNGWGSSAIADAGDRFVCGDADGFPIELRERVKQKVSLSAMTYSHELARVMLAEQIYRAFAILSGSPYPK